MTFISSQPGKKCMKLSAFTLQPLGTTQVVTSSKHHSLLSLFCFQIIDVHKECRRVEFSYRIFRFYANMRVQGRCVGGRVGGQLVVADSVHGEQEHQWFKLTKRTQERLNDRELLPFPGGLGSHVVVVVGKDWRLCNWHRAGLLGGLYRTISTELDLMARKGVWKKMRRKGETNLASRL